MAGKLVTSHLKIKIGIFIFDMTGVEIEELYQDHFVAKGPWRLDMEAK